VKFAHQDNPEAVAFIDTGRLIKVFDENDASLLAALQLAQQKWGGVQVNGTDEYKRKCAELAAKNGIRVVNPELQSILKEIREEKCRENSMSVFTMAKVLGQKMLNEPMIIVTSAREGKEYEGVLLDVLEKDGRFYAVQHYGDNHIILHEAEQDDVFALKILIGREAGITSENGRIQDIVDSEIRNKRLERNRGWGR
jgi:hypothetical protein